METLDPLTIGGDPVLFELLVHNLLSNAIRYNVAGGRVKALTGPVGLTACDTGALVPADVTAGANPDGGPTLQITFP
jgi:signal transduction histidine kinase